MKGLRMPPRSDPDYVKSRYGYKKITDVIADEVRKQQRDAERLQGSMPDPRLVAIRTAIQTAGGSWQRPDR